MSDKLNVQAKWAGTDTWHNFGAVSLAGAAQELMRLTYSREVVNNKPYAVHVRYEAKPDTVWTVMVTRRVVYDATPLRFDGE